MFPLNSVLFPGATVPLHVFEDRYRALVHALLRIEDPAERLFGTVAIREGYEVGDHGAQSLHVVGCLLQLTEVESNADGTFEIEAVARGRIRLHRLDGSGTHPTGEVDVLPDEEEAVSPAVVAQARGTWEAYADQLTAMGGGEPVVEGTLPRDPVYLSWALSGAALLTLQQRQQLLEAEGAQDRLTQVARMLREELRSIRAIPSLPAVRVARTAWSPN
jgi:Lon protease-like protein